MQVNTPVDGDRGEFLFSNNSSEELEIESAEARLKALFNFPADYFLFESFKPEPERWRYSSSRRS